MEPKKNPAFDVHRKSRQFFLIGLCCSLGITITAFQWTTRVEQVLQPPDTEREWDATAVIEVTSFPEPERPRAPQQSSQTLTLSSNIVPTSEQVEVDFLPEPSSELSIDSGIFVLAEPEPEPTEEITDWAEKMPEPDGGYDQFYKTVSKHLKYPRQAIRAGVEGRVFVQFTIRKDGTVTDVKLLKGIGYGCDEEAVRVMGIPKWKPGRQGGRTVNVRMVQPLVFEIP